MNILFAKMPNVLVYMDDIIVFSDNLEEHLKHLKSVFKKLQNHNLKIQLDKTEFFKRELLYLGHIVSERGIQPNPAKLQAIKDFKIPKTEKQIKQFLGLTGYYRKMIQNYAKIAKPLTQALKKDVKIDINNTEYVNAFEKLKTMLQNSPILQLPDFSKQFIVTTDASNYAIGGVLSQVFEGKDLPVAYASRTLNKHEINLSTIEKELLAIVWCCKYFRPYLYGRKFLIQTDHKPLQWLHSIKEPNSKLIRWKLLLEEFDFDIIYINGKTNYVADALSRPNNVHMMENEEDDFLGFEDGFRGFANIATDPHETGLEDGFHGFDNSAHDPDHEFDDINVDELLRFNTRTEAPSIDVSSLDEILQQIDNPAEGTDNDDIIGIDNRNDGVVNNDANENIVRDIDYENVVNNNENGNEPEDDNNSLATIHSQESSNEQVTIADDDKILNVEHNQLVLERGDQPPRLIKIFDKNRLIIYFRNANDYDDMKDKCIEYLKPNTKYGVFCSRAGALYDEYERIFNNFKNVLLETFDSIKLKRYKRMNLDVTQNDEQNQVISNYHEGKTFHRGINESYNQIRRKYYWPSMLQDMTGYINKCAVCLKVKYDGRPVRVDYKITPTPETPFEKIQIDCFQYDKIKFLTMTDCFSKRLTVHPIKSLNQVDIQECLNDYFSAFPIPKIVQMDNGREFDNAGLRDFLRLYGIEPYYVTPGHPDSQGLVERTHSTLIEILNAIQLENKTNTTETNMKLAVIAFNNTLNSTLKMSPMEITYGISNNPFVNGITERLVTEQLSQQYLERVNLVHKMIKNKIEEEKQKRTEKLNVNREKNVEIENEPHIKSTFNKKTKPKFIKVNYDATQQLARSPKAIQKRPFKLHPNRMKRPKKPVKGKKKDLFVTGRDGTAPNSPVAGPSNVL
ncbi:uncharacterized protein LOC120353595 [Nilaparvata lugens]|uniref:uncharacterized protein LOC120353595 n=1 Tax=Nilaparvata lugens TaxID=108931 RepID=UPI00193CCE07|nr:uncharacterized protein LOC120353595 [Nilaparvata lugens]